MTMAFLNRILSIELTRERTFTQITRIRSQAHCAAVVFILHFLRLLIDQVDDWVWCRWIDLSCVCLLIAEHVARKLDERDQTDGKSVFIINAAHVDWIKIG